MSTDASRQDLPLSGRLLARLLDQRRKLDLVWVAAFAAWPLVLAWLVGAHRTADGFAGYWARTNWVMLPVVLPAAVQSMRWLVGRMAPVSAPWRPERLPPVIQLVEGETGRRQAYEALRAVLLSKPTLLLTLAAAGLVQLLDMASLVRFYAVALDSQDASELTAQLGGQLLPDWSVAFAAARHNPVATLQVSLPANALLVACAYTVQFALITVGLLLVVLFLRHNWFFLSRIYQRRRVTPGDEHAWIHVRLDDEDRCFGFRPANDAFNAQVLVLGFAALAMLGTRFANVGPGTGLVTTIGQFLVLAGWLVGLAMVALPAVVKLLPRLPLLGGGVAGLTIQGYLREFLSDDVWSPEENPPREELDAIAGLFAENSFWPSGNNRAKQLFFFSFWAFFVALVPDLRAFPVLATGPAWLVPVGWVGAALVAWGATALIFWFLRWRLAFVDERLAKPPSQSPEGREEVLRRRGRIQLDVFISYRRSDSAAYAGRLRDSLEERLDPARVFMDVETLEAGADFPTSIREALGKARAVLLVIGPTWLQSIDGQGRRRLDDPQDFVRLEVVLALASSAKVLPLLVGGAAMPGGDALPPELAALASRTALEISDSRWDFDIGRVLAALDAIAHAPPERFESTPTAERGCPL